MDVQATKIAAANAILANSAYTQDSGMIQRLREQLLKLSKDDLGCLKLVIEIGRNDAADARQDLLTDAMKQQG